MQKNDERGSVARAKTDSEAFIEIFDMYYQKILLFAVYKTGNILLAQEIVSRTFVSARRHLRRFRRRNTSRPISIETWLFRIAIRESYRRKSWFTAGKRQHSIRGLDIVMQKAILKEAQTAQAALDQEPQFVAASKSIRRLPVAYQLVVILYMACEHQAAGIAQILNQTESITRAHLAKGLSLLQADLSKIQRTRATIVKE